MTRWGPDPGVNSLEIPIELVGEINQRGEYSEPDKPDKVIQIKGLRRF